ncbi:unnamed protein product [Coccothraustes coccothraustes]
MAGGRYRGRGSRWVLAAASRSGFCRDSVLGRKWLGITKAIMQTSAHGLLCGSRECVSIQPSDKASTWH